MKVVVGVVFWLYGGRSEYELALRVLIPSRYREYQLEQSKYKIGVLKYYMKKFVIRWKRDHAEARAERARAHARSILERDKWVKHTFVSPTHTPTPMAQDSSH